MQTHKHSYKPIAGAAALLLGSLASNAALGDNEIEDYYLNQPFAQKTAQTFKLNHSDKPYESLKFSKDFRIKGWEVAEGVYFGKAKIAGENGPGLIFEEEGYSWGFNHRGVALHIPL